MGSTYSPMNHILFMQVQPLTSKPIIFSPLTKGPRYGHKISLRPITCTAITTHEPRSSPILDGRRSANYKPTIWNDEFYESLKKNQVHFQENCEKLLINKEALHFEVKNRVADEGLEPVIVLELIDAIQRLGLSDDYDMDIKRSLNRLASNFGNSRLDLHTIALGFRIFRQNGIMVSQDVFKQFMNENGNFKPSLCNNIKGIISLYEASYFALENENHLDEAKEFTSKHLRNLCLNNEDEIIAKQANQTLLDLPIRYRMPKLEARHYMETYYTREDTKGNLTALHELAKLNFNMTQSKYQEEVLEMARWWKELGLLNNLSFTRDRIMECYFWGSGTVPNKSELSYCRRALTKVVKFITTLDDIYDVYGHLHELELFTIAVERWDINAIDDLPDYMKLTFLALYNTVNEIGYEILKQKGRNCIPFLKTMWEDLCKAFLVEAKWCYYNQTPTFEEYMNNAWVTVSGSVILSHAYLYVSHDITPEAIDCLKNKHDILCLPSMIFRLSNDLATSEDEMERGETVKAISCYAKEANVSLKVARKNIRKLIDQSWKRLNEIQVANETSFSNGFIETALNLARTSQCTYQQGDGYGSPEFVKRQILSIVVDPIQ